MEQIWKKIETLRLVYFRGKQSPDDPTRLTKDILQKIELDVLTGDLAITKALKLVAKKGDLRFLKQLESLLPADQIKWNTILKAAAKSGNVILINYCLDKTAENGTYGVHSLDVALEGAARGGHLSVVKFFLSNGAGKSRYQMSLLAAAKGNHPEIVYFLWGKVYTDWFTISRALNGACYSGNIELINFFISKGGRINNLSYLSSAVEGGHLTLASEIAKLSNATQSLINDTFFIASVKRGNLKTVKEFIPLITEHQINTGIYFASRYGHWDILIYLKDLGAKLHGAMNGAIEGGYLFIIEYLLKLGLNDWNHYALKAINSGYYDLFLLFLPQANNYEELIEAAIRADNNRILNILLTKKKLELNQLLCIASDVGNLEMIEKFIKDGATDIEHALECASEYETIEYLEKYKESAE